MVKKELYTQKYSDESFIILGDTKTSIKFKNNFMKLGGKIIYATLEDESKCKVMKFPNSKLAEIEELLENINNGTDKPIVDKHKMMKIYCSVPQPIVGNTITVKYLNSKNSKDYEIYSVSNRCNVILKDGDELIEMGIWNKKWQIRYITDDHEILFN